MHLPLRPADFTPQWLSTALEAGGAAPAGSVESLSIEPLAMSTGFTSNLYRITPKYVAGKSGPALSICLAMGLPVEDRRSHENRLLRRYHDALLSAGIQDYSFERALSDYRVGLLRLLVLLAISDDNFDLSTPAGRGLVDRYTERSVALRDWKCGEVVPL
jgi:hypothetical protein